MATAFSPSAHRPLLDRFHRVDECRRLPTMLILRGSPALSPFRLQKLLERITAAGGLPARALSAEFVHVIETSSDLTAAEQQVLEQLLTYGPTRAPVSIEGVQQVVAPRPGTISPWSSKATDIA